MTVFVMHRVDSAAGAHLALEFLRRGHKVLPIAGGGTASSEQQSPAESVGWASWAQCGPRRSAWNGLLTVVSMVDASEQPSRLETTLAALGEDEAEYWQLEDHAGPVGSDFEDYSQRTLSQIRLAAAIGCRRFVHLSAARTASDARAALGLDECVQEEGRRLGMTVWVLRPSVVVGPLQSLRCVPLSMAARRVAAKLGPRGTTRPSVDEVVNLLPVDRFVADVIQLLSEGAASGTYHSASAGATKLASLASGLEAASRAELPAEESFTADSTPLAEEGLEVNDALVRSHPALILEAELAYARALTDAHYGDGVAKQAEYHFHEPRAASFYKFGSSGPATIFINALGMPVEMCEPFLRRLATRRRLWTWEDHNLLDMSMPFVEAEANVDAQIATALELLDLIGEERVDIIAWCNGARVALGCVAQKPERTHRVIVISGAIAGGPECRLSRFAEGQMSIARGAKNRKRAEMLATIFAESPVDETAINQHAAPTSAYLRHIGRAPYRTGEALYRYAALLRSEATGEVNVSDAQARRALLVTAENDGIVHPDVSSCLAGAMPGAQQQVAHGADHWALFDDLGLDAIVEKFLESAPAIASASGSVASACG